MLLERSAVKQGWVACALPYVGVAGKKGRENPVQTHIL